MDARFGKRGYLGERGYWLFFPSHAFLSPFGSYTPEGLTPRVGLSVDSIRFGLYSDIATQSLSVGYYPTGHKVTKIERSVFIPFLLSIHFSREKVLLDALSM